MKNLILRSFQSPGDNLMLTAAVRDLHAAHPGEFKTDVRTSADAIWLHNPHRTPLWEGQSGVEILDMHYPLIHQSNQRPYHFIHGYVQYLEEKLRLRIPLTRFHGDIHLSPEEKQAPLNGKASGICENFWIIIAGGKYDFTTKWWDPASYQKVVDHFRGKIQFVQCGEEGHWHPRLNGVVDLIGKTSLREFIRLMHHAAGVVCPVTFAMHLAAAVETKSGRAQNRPCVVLAGGREPAHWETYPHHQFLSTVGTLSCCAEGGCWRSRCQSVGDGDEKDRRDLCEKPVQVRPDLRIAKCMHMITPEDVIRRIELYFEGGSLSYDISRPLVGVAPVPKQSDRRGMLPNILPPTTSKQTTNVLIRFGHGLGDAVQLTLVLQHLRKHRPEWAVDVMCLRGKHTALRGLCRRVFHDQEPAPDRTAYQAYFDLAWWECYSVFSDSPSTKACNCLREVFHIAPDPELCGYVIQPEQEDYAVTAGYLESIGGGRDVAGRFNAVVIHYEGNTSGWKKNLSHTCVAGMCASAIEAGFVPVILDWDRRSPLPNGKNIFCPAVGPDDIWGAFGSGDAARITALIAQAALFVGIDSGPGKCAGATSTPCVIVWTGHHPVQFHDLCPNTLHFVPEDHHTIPPAQNATAADYFAHHYQFQTYPRKHLTEQLCGHVRMVLGKPLDPHDGLLKLADFWCHADRLDQDWTILQDIYVRDGYKTCLLSEPQTFKRVVDVGAHIGAFSRLWAERVPGAKIVAVEVAPENLEPLRRNVGNIATVHHAACVGGTTGPVELLNSFTEPGRALSTGGSIVVRAGAIGPDENDPQYRREPMQCPTLTLRQIMDQQGWDAIDLLKLDCEGSEYEILADAPIPAIRFIVGEYHGFERWESFRAKHFADWDYGHMSRNGEFGNFHLRNPHFKPLLPEEVSSPLVFREGFWVRADNIEQDLVVVRDIFQGDAYRTSLLSNANHEEIVVDIGAHIGTFAKLWHTKNPKAKIVCVEANPDNIHALRKNVGDFATVIHAACSHIKEPLALLNAVRPNCESTGGSIVVPVAILSTAPGQPGYRYWHDTRSLPAITLEDILERIGADHIDVLKLDCEGSEYDILENTSLRRRIRMIVGEYHGFSRWEQFRLRVFLHWSYGHMFNAGEAGGIFHLACRCWPPTPDTSLREKIRANSLPSDKYLLECSEPFYDALLEVTRTLQPKVVLEVGVRAGYSALSFFEAGATKVIGIDNDSEPTCPKGYEHATEILADYDFELIRASSHNLQDFPVCDLALLDSDHSLAGLSSDLHKAARATGAILVDDYGPGNDVAAAVGSFLDRNRGWLAELIDFGDSVRKLALLKRDPRKILRIAVPSGIGDALWALVKVPALLKAEGADACDLDACYSSLPRSADFLARFDFVRHTGYTHLECVEREPVTADGYWNYAQTGRGWHNTYDWLLVPNAYLERGGRLEDWLPEFAPDWNIASHYRVLPEDERVADAVVAEIGNRFALFFASSLAGNTVYGHNRGPLWRPDEWAELARLFLAEGVTPVLIGAAWDRSYYDQVLKDVLPRGVLDRIDHWPIGVTFAVMRRAGCLVAYQSGLGIFGVYLGCNVAMWWRPHGDSILADRHVSFRDEMATAWAPPGAVESGRYLPLIYGRCSPQSIFAHSKKHWLDAKE